MVSASSLTDFVDQNIEEIHSDIEYNNEDVRNIDLLDMSKEETYAKIALDFANSFVKHERLTVSEMIPIFDVDKFIVAYHVKMTLDGVDNGYVIVDSRLSGDFIAEFNLELYTPDLFSSMVDSISNETNTSSKDVQDNEKMMLESETSVYNVNVDDVIMGTDGSVSDSEEFVSELESEQMSKSPHSHSQYAMVEYPVGYGAKSLKYLGNFKSLEIDFVKHNTLKYACSVSAATILMDKLNIDPGVTTNAAKLKNTYNALWKYSKTTVTSVSPWKGKNITFGGTIDKNWQSGLAQFAKDKKKSVTTKYIESPTFSQMKLEIDNNHNFIYGYDITNSDGGHAIAVQGYYIGIKNNKQHNFIVFADGWNKASRYMNMTEQMKYVKWSRLVSVW